MSGARFTTFRVQRRLIVFIITIADSDIDKITYFVNLFYMNSSKRKTGGRDEQITGDAEGERPSQTLDRKRERILEAAQQTFLRYGYRRTTMGDLAEAAGISRPALYLFYANKEALFRGVVVRYFEQLAERASQRVGTLGPASLEARIEALMETWVVEPFVEVHRSDSVSEIYEAGHTLAEDLRERFTEVFAGQIESVLSGAVEHGVVNEQDLKRSGFPLDRIAAMIARSSLGLKREVADLSELKQVLNDQCRWNCRILESRDALERG